MSDSTEQRAAAGFGHDQFDINDNSDRRCPTVLLLDVSGSMAGKPLEEMQAGLAQYIDEIAADSLAKRRLEIAIVTFGGTVTVAQDFATPDRIAIPTLRATGDTPMGKAIVEALDLLKERRMELSRNAIPQYKPWVFLITDGGPTDDNTEIWRSAVKRLEENRRHKMQFFAVGVENANMEKLKELCSDGLPPIKLHGLKFRSLFEWLTASQKAVSNSQPGDKIQIMQPTWGGFIDV